MMRRFCIGVVAALLLALGCEGIVQVQGSCDQTLSPGDNVASAIESAPSGWIMCLSDGSYGGLNLGSFTKNPRVTVRSVNALGAILDGMSVSSGESPNGLIVEGVSWSDDVSFSGGNDARNITIRNSEFGTHQIYIETQSYDGNNILIDGNTFGAYDKSGVGEGRITVRYPGGPGPSIVGVTVSNNAIGPGGCSDGVHTGSNGVVIGPGNVFTGIVQGGCETHVDGIQGYGDRNTVVTGNYFDGSNTVDVGWYDGGNGHAVTHNVLQDAVTSFRGLDATSIIHNTFIGSDFRIEGKSGNPSSMTIQDNILLDVSVVGSLACDSCAISHNQFSSGGFGSNNIIGAPTFVGGPSPSTYAGFFLEEGSIGEDAATDGEDMGINGEVGPEPPVITSPLTATGTAGDSFQYQIVATNATTSYGGGGSGLSVNASTGLLSGVLPAQAGTLSVPISATNEHGTDTETLVITVNAGPEPPGPFTITFHEEIDGGGPPMAIGDRTISATGWATRTDTTIPAPAGVEDGDVLLLAFVIGDSTPPTPTLPTGFQILSGPNTVTTSGFSVTRRLAWKVANSEPASYVVDHDNASSEGLIIRIPGGDGATAPVVTTNGGAGTTTTALGLDTPADGSYVGFIVHNWQLYGSASPPGGTTPTFTESLDSASSLVYYADGILATQGATGDKSHDNQNVNSADSWGAYLVSIGPAPGGQLVEEAASLDATADVSSRGRLSTAGTTMLSATSDIALSDRVDAVVGAGLGVSAVLSPQVRASVSSDATLPVSAALLSDETVSALEAIGLDASVTLSPAEQVLVLAVAELQVTGSVSAVTGNLVLEAIGLNLNALVVSQSQQSAAAQLALQIEASVEAMAQHLATASMSMGAEADVASQDQATISASLILGVASSLDAVGSELGGPDVTRLVAVELRRSAAVNAAMKRSSVVSALLRRSGITDPSMES